jgi:hypothetical protein
MKASAKKTLQSIDERLGAMQAEVETLLAEEEEYASDLESESKLEASENRQDAYGELLELLSTASSAIVDLLT